jgi:hypothetical protein
MSSTAFAAATFRSRRVLQSILREASGFGRLGVRAVLLIITGSLSVSYLQSRFCVCGAKFSFEHFLSCPTLGCPLSHVLSAAIDNQDWKEAAIVLLSRFEVFLHAVRGGELSIEESDLFDSLNEACEEAASA